MVLHFAGESIECDECEIVTRKFVPSSAIKHPVLGLITKYEFSRNCSTKNLKELNPKKFVVKLTSNLDIGTILSTDSIFLLTKRLKPLKWSLINQSHRHKASGTVIDSFTFAEIKYPLENVLNAMAKRKEIT